MDNRPLPDWLATIEVGHIVAFPQTSQFRATVILPARVERVTKARLMVLPKGYAQTHAVDRHTGRVIGSYQDYINAWTTEAQQDYQDRRDRESLGVTIAKFNYREAPIATVRKMLALLQEAK
jgi:hypothetical protein